VQPFGTARDLFVTLSSSCGRLSARRRAKGPCQPRRHARSGLAARPARILRWNWRACAAWPSLPLWLSRRRRPANAPTILQYAHVERAQLNARLPPLVAEPAWW